jgi:lipid-A-disaccharide synthase
LAAGIPVRDLPATTPLAASLAAFDAAIAASGTATLECALAGVPPVIAYRVDPLSAALFRRLATTPRVGLPNVLLGRDVFPELLQEAATPEALAAAARGVLANPPNVGDELLEHVRPNDGRTFAARVASLAEAL